MEKLPNLFEECGRIYWRKFANLKFSSRRILKIQNFLRFHLFIVTQYHQKPLRNVSVTWQAKCCSYSTSCFYFFMHQRCQKLKKCFLFVCWFISIFTQAEVLRNICFLMPFSVEAKGGKRIKITFLKPRKNCIAVHNQTECLCVEIFVLNPEFPLAAISGNAKNVVCCFHFIWRCRINVAIWETDTLLQMIEYEFGVERETLWS